MILRRIIAHVRNQQWTAIALDFVIVVVGVFVGIQASNLNTDRTERKMAAEYAERIVADLDVVLDRARSQRGFEQEKSREVVMATALTGQPPSDQKSLELGNLLTLLSIRLSPNYESPTFNDIQNSGRIALIRDAELRKKLSAYFSRLQYLRAAIGRNNDAHVETYVDFLRREAIGAGYADPADVPPLKMLPIEEGLSAVSRQRFGSRDIHANSAQLAAPSADAFWPRLRAALSWRGVASAANENILNLLITESEAMKQEVEKAQKG